ncbi:MAG: amino acid adenylation domain-containing protein [Prevotella sp.]|nr:amino acid adenylation domain-containing protein [Prevotella sp.]
MTNEASISSTYPLLPSQEGIYYAWMSRIDATCWNLPICMTYGREIDRTRLQEALHAIIAQRATLRLQLTVDEKGQPRQYIDPTLTIDVPCREMSESAALDYCQHHFVRPFVPFSKQPLCRFEILSTPEHHYLLFDLHHLIGDGVTISHAFLSVDLPHAYDCQPLDKDDYGMLDAALSQEALYGTARYLADRHYFHERFRHHPFTPLCGIPANPWGRYLRSSSFMDRKALDLWCKNNGISPNVLFSAAFSLVLSRLSGERETAFLTLFHGRSDRRLRNAWGMFVSTLPQLVSHHPSDTIGSLLLQNRQEQFRALRHSSYPLTHFCNNLHHTPTVTFGFQSEQIPESIVLDGHLYPGVQLQYAESRNELSCMIYVHGSTYEIRVDCSSAWHDADYLKRFAQAVSTIVEQLTTLPQTTPLDHLSLVNPSEQQFLTALGTGKSLAWPEEETLTRLIHRQVLRSPSATAIHDIHGFMSYEQLWQASGHLSCALHCRHIGHGDIVAISLPHDRRFLVAAIAVLRSGASYLPLDPNHPPLRHQQLLSDSCARLLIDQTMFATLAAVDVSSTTTPHEESTIDYSRVGDMAYLMYTSGTTGKPKGVMVSHHSLCHFSYVTAHLWHLSDKSRISCHAPFTFDASVEDLYPVLTCGGTVFLPDEAILHDLHALRRYLAHHHITGGCYTPQFAHMLTEGHPLDVDYLCVGGDRMTHVPETSGRLLNTYGPTEFTVNATYHDVNKSSTANIPIGRPLPNLHAFVMDYAGHLLPRGMVGELCLGGPQMAMGYWKRVEETAQQFAYFPSVGMSLYHTGDYTRWNDDGLLEYIGRRDDQLELNGQRIEPSEIEHVLCQHHEIIDACLSVQISGGQGQLCAHYVCREHPEKSRPYENNDPLEGDLKLFLRQRLPSYMIPQLWQRVERLPLNYNGKVDRKHLPPIVKRPHPVITATCNDIEMRLLSLFRQVLNRDDIDVTDSFFDMGGTSLSAMELVSRAREVDLAIDYAMIFRWSDVRSLSAHLVGTSDNNPGLWHLPHEFRPVPISPLSQKRESPIGDLLITGCTGFLGSHILVEYLIHEQGTAYCLVRGEDEVSARRRLQNIVGDILGHAQAERFAPRIVIVLGDLCREDTLEMFDDIHVDTLIHCAANVSHYAPMKLLWDVNVEGTRRVLRHCLRHGTHLLHLSTLSVGGIDGEGHFLQLKEQEYYKNQSFVDPYDYTKFMAEHIVLEAIAHEHLSATIVRPGFLVSPIGRADLIPNRTDLLATIDHLSEELGILPRRIASIPIIYSPVDEAAREVLSFAMEDNGGIIRHLHTVEEKTAGEMMLSRHPALRWVEDSVFQSALKSLNEKERYAVIAGIIGTIPPTH